jgi:hypothetical protein
MADPDRSTHSASRTRAAPKTSGRLVWPAMLGIALGTAVGGYLFWSHGQAQQAGETATDPGLDKPTAEECAIAQAALKAIHASGDDAGWRANLGPLTLKARSQGINPVDVPGYADDEADNLRGKTIADWRGCAGMGAYVRGLSWSAMRADEDIAEVGLARPGVSASGDQAKVYELVAAPRQDAGGALMLARGPRLVTLARGPNQVWRVTTTSDLSRRGH